MRGPGRFVMARSTVRALLAQDGGLALRRDVALGGQVLHGPDGARIVVAG